MGKTTLSALIANSLHAGGRSVVAIDADPDSNLLACLGYPHPERVKPLVELKDLIEKRTGVKPGTVGGMFRMNPRVDDIPAKYAVDIDGIKVLVAGAVKKGGAGCYCPENAFVRALVSYLLLDDNTDLVLDMEAGIEHLGRGTISAVDWLLVVVEPGKRSVETALRIKKMASNLKLERVCAVGNKIRSLNDKKMLKHALSGIDFAGFIPYDHAFVKAELEGRSVYGASRAVDNAAGEIVKILSQSRG
ncbi:MAG: carbon monoxide dehydrogenase [Kiritimatiellae bacterium]|nr:carbon monoxide dehydrogenase [Kiritimatiellia bacterium]